MDRPVDRRKKIALALAAPAVALVLVELVFGSRLAFAYRVRQLHSSEPMTRLEGRDALLALGRPAVDPALPEIVAIFATEEVASGGAIVVAASIASESSSYFVVRVERPVLVTDPRALDAKASETDVVRARDERVADAEHRLESLLGGLPRARSLVVLGVRDDAPVLRSALPLDGELGKEILAAVEAKKAELRAR